PVDIGGVAVPVNRYFLNHPEMVLGTWSRKDTLYGEGFSVTGNGDLAEQLREAIERLPASPRLSRGLVDGGPSPRPAAGKGFPPPPPQRHIAEGSFFVGADRAIRQVVDGQAVPVVYGGARLTADGTLTGRRLAALIRLRDRARRVLQSQNEGWPERHRDEARRELNSAYDPFPFTYGPINKTTFR